MTLHNTKNFYCPYCGQTLQKDAWEEHIYAQLGMSRALEEVRKVRISIANVEALAAEIRKSLMNAYRLGSAL